MRENNFLEQNSQHRVCKIIGDFVKTGRKQQDTKI